MLTHWTYSTNCRASQVVIAQIARSDLYTILCKVKACVVITEEKLKPAHQGVVWLVPISTRRITSMKKKQQYLTVT